MAKKPKGTSTDAKREKRGKAGKPTKIAKKAGQSILGLANSELGREILADALMAAANAAAAALVRVGARGQMQSLGIADLKAEAAHAGKDFARTATGAIAGAVVDAARRLLPANDEAVPVVAAKRRATKRATPAAAKSAARTPAKKPTAAKRAAKATSKAPAAKRAPAKARAAKAAKAPSATPATEAASE